jgi:Ca2+-binding EF-hand superfamily protein
MTSKLSLHLSIYTNQLYFDLFYIYSTSEFTEEEILGAFKFMDLDKNNFIGAAEIRHLLICMGELITDEEIDQMISLCDQDGDGQVSFEEFRRMVIHPDPSSPDFMVQKYDEENEETAAMNRATEATGATKTSSEEKQREIEIKEEKKRLMKRFVNDLSPNLGFLMRIFQKFKQMDQSKSVIDFDDFCMLFEIEPTGEYRRLFGLYTATTTNEEVEDESEADLRQILLGIVNFMDQEATDKMQRVKFCFELFDDDHNGFITEDELINILKANHMASSHQIVKKKAQTIMKQADSNGDSRMSLEEFYQIAKKFPNLLFPSYEASTSSTSSNNTSSKVTTGSSSIKNRP